MGFERDILQFLTKIGRNVVTLLQDQRFGWIILIAGIALIAIMLGLSISIYLTLLNLHLMTAIVITIGVTMLFYIGTRVKIITEKTIEKYPWMWLIIPGAFIFGYAAELAQNISLTVSPLTIAEPSQASINAIAIFILVLGCLGIFAVRETRKRKQRK